MARLVLTSAGSHGDFLPLVRLGCRLRDRGHEVRCAINSAMWPLAEAARLPVAPCGRPFGAAEARQHPEAFDFWKDYTDDELRAAWGRLDLEGSYRDLLAACADANLVIASRLQSAAAMVHERTGIPWISVATMPGDYPHPGDPPAEEDPNDPLATEVWALFNRVRARVGLRPLTVADQSRYSVSPRLVLLVSSRHFSQPALESCPQLRMTGYWFDPAPPDWTPTAELVDFLNQPLPPLLLTHGSMPVDDPAQLVAVHAQAAAVLDRRLLVQSGWAGLEQGDWDRRAVLVIGEAPHAWLFPQVAAVIHHGGMGTTAECLRWARPMLLEPLGNDQFFNARRVLALGVGAVMHPHKLTANGLTRILAEKVLIPEVEQRARAVAELLRAEDGLTVACDLIEAELRRLKPPAAS
jgi:UDP:flavonoid glycosyltransferase YjiC (YdhE family)